LLEDIKNVFRDLIGLKLTRMTRAADIECIYFGTKYLKHRDGNVYNFGELNFHMQCPWRFTNKSNILVGSADLFYPVDENAPWEENFDYDNPNGNLRDIRIDNLLKEYDLIVQDAKLDSLGGFEITFNDDIVFSAFPNNSDITDDEFWRILDFRSEDLESENAESIQYVCWNLKKEIVTEE
jgi:hypothetical protein